MGKINVIQHPSIVLIIGRRRAGKSALGYHILDNFHNEQSDIKVFVVSLPKRKHHLLPDWIIPVDDVEELPDNCIALIDEGALKYHAYKWNTKETIVMDRLISISGQKKQTFIFITHTMRKFAVTLLLDVDVLLVKKPSLLHSKLERSEVRKLVEEITREFNKLPKDDVKKSFYVVSDDFTGFLRNPLPPFWSEDLSEAYAGIPINKKEEKEEKAISMPIRIDSGLKIWFKKKDTDKVLKILSKNSEIDGTLSKMGVQCSDGKCFYSFDLKKGKDGKYHPSSKKFNIEASIGEFKENNIPIVLDVESAYSLNKEDVALNIEETVKEKKEDKLEEFAKKMEL